MLDNPLVCGFGGVFLPLRGLGGVLRDWFFSDSLPYWCFFRGSYIACIRLGVV
jgi:hypothetical protein